MPKKTRRTVGQWVVIAERLARKNKGVLPKQDDQKRVGFPGLPQVIQNNPKAFAHIPKFKRTPPTLEQLLAQAEKIAKANGGKLPTAAALNGDGKYALAKAITRHPKTFQHLRTKSVKTIEEWVKIAEDLAKKYGGKLPPTSRLQKDGVPQAAALIGAIYRFPESFAHIREVRKHGHSAEEWLKIAKKLVKKNGGFLPPSHLLIKDGVSGLVAAKYAHPKMFEDIKWNSEGKLTQKQIRDAAKEQKISDLAKQAHDSFKEFIKTDPVASIRSPKLGTQVIIATRLTKKLNGFPSDSWLLKNGMSGILEAKKEHPEAFAHLLTK